MIRLLFVFLFSLPAYSAIKVEMDFSASNVKQGELIESRLEIQNAENLQISKLKGQSIGKILYFYDISPLMKREGAAYYEAEAKVIFINTPKSKIVQEVVNGQDVELNIGNIEVMPTEGAKSLIFGKFSVPERATWIIWAISGVLIAIILGLLGWSVTRTFKRKRKEKQRLVDLKNEILGCRNYEEVVNLWKKKHQLFKEFPHIEDSFLKLEEILNRYQFKPRQSETEKIEVVESYRKFSRSVEGGFSGL